MKSSYAGTIPAPLLALMALATPLVLAFFPAVALPAEPSAAQSGPRQVVAALTAELLSALDRNRGALRRDPEQFLPVADRILLPHFDADYTARLILGPHGRAATPEQRERFAVAIYHAAIRAYSGELSEFTADRIKILPENGDPSAAQAIVRTQVTRSGGAALEIDYRLHKTEQQGWQVIDLIVEGISYVRNYREDFDAEISHKGLEAVIARLERRESAAPVFSTASTGGTGNAH
jgi:phospholipid transport system substrate-binding protein